MTDKDESQAQHWENLYRRVREFLTLHGKEHFLGDEDFWVLSDNYGFNSINIAVHRLAFLSPAIIQGLQRLLVAYPRWEILVAIDVPGKENVWPSMGLKIRRNDVVDGLQREYFPLEFQGLHFVNAKKGRWH